MFKFFRRNKAAPPKPVSAFTTDVYQRGMTGGDKTPKTFQWSEPEPVPGATMDSSIDGTVPLMKSGWAAGVPEAQSLWYASQTFIGYPMCALIAKHWLVDKACSITARDALRQGYRIDCDHNDTIEALKRHDKLMRTTKTLKDYIHFGRVYGGQIALFRVYSTDPDYYENPFNLDGVGVGCYQGIALVDPINAQPELTSENVQDPAHPNYMMPTYWRIGGRRYHHSHLRIFVPYDVAKIAKPSYRYFGVSVPERVYERVYAAERTANEAPQLAMTKRLLTMGVPDFAGADKDVVAENVSWFLQMRDNYGVNMSDDGTVFQQFDTALADLDVTIMTQYQLVAAAANVPATKLLGTTPKGFNATGEYEEATYREELESIQSNDLDPLLDRHYELLAKSLGQGEHDITIQWAPLDSPTAKEYAEINNLKAQADQAWVNVGAIDGEDVRERLRSDPDSDYFGLEEQTGYEDYEDPTAMGEEPQGSDRGQPATLPSSPGGTIPQTT